MRTNHKIFGIATILFFALMVGTLDYARGQGIPVGPSTNSKPTPTSGGSGEGPAQKQKKVKKSKIKVARTGNHVMTLKLGGALHHFYGDIDKSNPFNTQVISPMATGMLGIKYGKRKQGSSVGIFGTYGSLSEAGAKLVNQVEAASATTGQFIEIEGGVLLGQFFRLSGGYGFNDVYANKGDSESLVSQNYFCATSGFSFGLGTKYVRLQMMSTIMFSQDEDLITWRPSIGLSTRFDMFRKRH